MSTVTELNCKAVPLQDCREYHADKGLQETQGWSTGLIHTGSSIGRADQGSMLLVQNIVQGL